MKRVLILASVASMIDQFNMPNIKLLQEMGYEVDVACNFREGNTCSDEKIESLIKTLKAMKVRCYQVDFARNIAKFLENLKAFWQVEKILEENHYEFLHCHSPIGGVVGRVAGKIKKVKVIYTAHGFHFYQGAQKKNWLVYYPVEWICSWMTDILICINKEDYALAKERMHAKRVEYVPGVGVDLDKFRFGMGTRKLRYSLAIPQDAEWIVTVGELIPRKNHEILIRAVSKLPGIYLTIVGQGQLKDYLQQMIEELGVSDRVKLLGFRNDIPELCAESDIFAFPSLQEGLPVAMMEAMASEKPIICSKIRGNVDLLEEEKGGYFFELGNEKGIVNAILKIINSDKKAMGRFNQRKMKMYSISQIEKYNRKIYSEVVCKTR